MKRVNLLEYFNLAESLLTAKRATAPETSKGGTLFFAFNQLPERLRAFVGDDNGFATCKHVATELADEIDAWIANELMDGSSPATLLPESFNKDFESWRLGGIPGKMDAFKHVFEVECRDVDVYSVGKISLYRTSELVTTASNTLPQDVKAAIPYDAAIEFDDAGRCLAFGLPTACGFHALRGLELTIEGYLRAFGVKRNLKSWNDYVEAAKALAESSDEKKPAKKVAAMIDRMRELDRNPLMHPRDTLDETGADMLFRLSTITVVEIIKDLKANQRSIPDADNDAPTIQDAIKALSIAPDPDEEGAAA